MAQQVLHPDTQTFDSLVSGEGVALVDFFATWCAPCRMLAPVIEQIAEQYDGRVKVAKVDIDAHPELASRYGVQSIPTVLVFKNGEMVAREVGARPLGTFTGILDGQLK